MEDGPGSIVHPMDDHIQHFTLTEDIRKTQRSPQSTNEVSVSCIQDDDFWENVRLGSEAVIQTIKEIQLADRDVSTISMISFPSCSSVVFNSSDLIDDPVEVPTCSPSHTGEAPQSKREVFCLPSKTPKHSIAGLPGKETANDCSQQSTNNKNNELQPLRKPVETLSLFFTLLSSGNWEKKIEGMKIIQALAQHHSLILMPKLHHVCLVLIPEVKNLRSAVACSAIKTLHELYVNLQKAMDLEVEVTGQALLLKLNDRTAVILHEEVNAALDAMVQNCSYSRCVSALLNVDLNHCSVGLKHSTAQHLHQLVDRMGADHMMTAGKNLPERVLSAVCKMSLDSAQVVREAARMILWELALHKNFRKMWMKVVPEKERHPLEKILGNMAANDCSGKAKLPLRNQAHKKANDCILQTTNNRGAALTDRNLAKKEANDCRRPTANNKNDELQPLKKPVETPSLFFTLLSSDNWEKKIEGMKIIQALAQHHSLILMPKLHHVCLVLIPEVINVRSAVARSAIKTLHELYVNLQKAMDPEVEVTGQALLLKLKENTTAAIHEEVNAALDAMVQNCSYSRCVSALLNTGLNHRSVAIKHSTAQHLHQLVDRMGVDHMMTAGWNLPESVLSAVCKMSLDPAQEVREAARMILRKLALHKNFRKMWMKFVPEKERHPLEKILGNMAANDCSGKAMLPLGNQADKIDNDYRSPTANNKNNELQPLKKPVETLSLFFTLLSSDNWEKKIEGMKIIQALAQHHSLILMPKLHHVCLVLIPEVINVRSAVACSAIKTLHELYVNLQKAMNPEVEVTGQALLLKLRENTTAAIHEEVNAALDAMVQNCSYSRCVSALLNTGLNHRSVALKHSTAQHLHQLVDRMGVDHMMTAGKNLPERVLSAVCKMSLDPAQEVREAARMILRELALHKNFQKMWMKVVPEKERHPLEKILGNMAANDCSGKAMLPLGNQANKKANDCTLQTTNNRGAALTDRNLAKKEANDCSGKAMLPLRNQAHKKANDCTLQTTNNRGAALADRNLAKKEANDCSGKAMLPLRNQANKKANDCTLQTTNNRGAALADRNLAKKEANDCSGKAMLPLRNQANKKANDCTLQTTNNRGAALADRNLAKKKANDCRRPTANNKNDEPQPLRGPAEKLSLFFTLLSSGNWEKKIEGMKTMQALAQHHSLILMPKLHHVCLVLIPEVKNLRSAVACSAIKTLHELYVNLQKAMDPEVEVTGQALLLKLNDRTAAILHEEVNAAIDAMVQNCSYSRCVSALLNVDLNHCSVALKHSTAQHLRQLVDRMGVDHMMTAGRALPERVLSAVCKMSVDATQEVRYVGRMILWELALHKNFLKLWENVVPERDRCQLKKTLYLK